MRESLTPRENGKSSANDGRERSPSPQMGNDRSNTANIQHLFSNIFDTEGRQAECWIVYDSYFSNFLVRATLLAAIKTFTIEGLSSLFV